MQILNIGWKNKKMYSLGDAVVVAVTNTDVDRRTIDLEFVDEKDKFFYE